MSGNEIQIFWLFGFVFLFFLGLVSWYLFIGPRWAVARVLAKPEEFDRSLPQFVDMDASWMTCRILPLPGLKTVWKIQTSGGVAVGQIHIGGFYKGKQRGANLVQIGATKFWVYRNMDGFNQNGFIFKSENIDLKLLLDSDYSFFDSIKNNFKNLKLQNQSETLLVQSDAQKRIFLLKNGQRMAIGTYPLATFPGHAALSLAMTDFDKAVLFYSMLIR